MLHTHWTLIVFCSCQISVQENPGEFSTTASQPEGRWFDSLLLCLFSWRPHVFTTPPPPPPLLGQAPPTAMLSAGGAMKGWWDGFQQRSKCKRRMKTGSVGGLMLIHMNPASSTLINLPPVLLPTSLPVAQLQAAHFTDEVGDWFGVKLLQGPVIYEEDCKVT